MEITNEMSRTAIDYKKNIAGKFMLVEGAKMRSRIAGSEFWVTRKIDGHLQILFYCNGEVQLLNSRGIDKAGQLKCMDDAAGCLKTAGVKEAVVAAELYLPREGGRPRCADVQAALADPASRDRLCLAPFDILSLEGNSFTGAPYGEVYAKLSEIFKCDSVHPVQMMKASSMEDLQAIYDEWVECDGAEGLVVHSDCGIVSKVKPRHSIDAAVVGYTTGEQGVRDLMFAVRHVDGAFQVFSVGSGGLSEDDRRSLAERLGAMNVESQYVLTDSRGIAYQMVRPEIVWEVSVLELVARGNDDKVRTNALIRYDDEKGWLHEGMTPGVSAFGLTLIRERDDKTPAPELIGVSQLIDLCPFEEPQAASGPMQESTLLDRRVYRKRTGDKVMLHKFLIWKTNKDGSGRYPAYIFYHTDYSSGRKDILKRDMAYAPTESGIRAILEEEVLSNVKSGWEAVA